MLSGAPSGGSLSSGERVRVRGKEAAEESSALGLDDGSVPLTPAPISRMGDSRIAHPFKGGIV